MVFAPLRLTHHERYAPLYEPITEGHALYALAAWAFHHAEELPVEQWANIAFGLSQAWPKRPGQSTCAQSSTRRNAQWAHYWVEVLRPDIGAICFQARAIGWKETEIRVMLPTWRQEAATNVHRDYALQCASAHIGLSADRITKLARGYRSEADAAAKDGYGIPSVLLAYPERHMPADVPRDHLLTVAAAGQAMLDPTTYRDAHHDEAEARRRLREQWRAGMR